MVAEPAPEDRLDAIVIGAGFGGLAAARRLRTHGLRVVILEASGRVGGRALSDYRLADGAPLELGAQMVHGRHVVTHEWIRRAGLHVEPLRVHQRSRLVIGRKVGRFPWFALPFHPVVGTRATLEGFRRIPRRLEEYSGPDRTLQGFLDQLKVAPAARALVDVFHSHSYSTDPDSIGIVGPAEEGRLASEPFGFRNFRLVEGYSSLVDRISGELRDAIRVNCPVSQVEVAEEGVRVRTLGKDGTAGPEFRAESAIVTVSLGVLKAGAIRFDPPLPTEKRAAIERIGFGNAFALHLRVRGGSFRQRLGDFGVLWGDTSTSFRRYRDPIAGGEEIVTAFTTGREARRRASLDDAGLVRATQEEWSSVAPAGADWGEVVGWVVHRWPTDPWVRGGYSFLPLGSRLADRARLAGPIDGRLFFAGEATDVAGGSATVPGALRTGERAAEELLTARRARSVPATGSSNSGSSVGGNVSTGTPSPF